jgi:hypothetical protein
MRLCPDQTIRIILTFQLGDEAARVPVRIGMRQLPTPRCPPSGDRRPFPPNPAKKNFRYFEMSARKIFRKGEANQQSI